MKMYNKVRTGKVLIFYDKIKLTLKPKYARIGMKFESNNMR